MGIKMTEKQRISTSKYRTIIRTYENIIKKLYSAINNYLQNILNAPSTINRVLKYYGIGFNPSEPNKRYIYFNGEVVKEFELVLPRYDGLYRKDLLEMIE